MQSIEQGCTFSDISSHEFSQKKVSAFNRFFLHLAERREQTVVAKLNLTEDESLYMGEPSSLERKAEAPNVKKALKKLENVLKTKIRLLRSNDVSVAETKIYLARIWAKYGSSLDSISHEKTTIKYFSEAKEVFKNDISREILNRLYPSVESQISELEFKKDLLKETIDRGLYLSRINSEWAQSLRGSSKYMLCAFQLENPKALSEESYNLLHEILDQKDRFLFKNGLNLISDEAFEILRGVLESLNASNYCKTADELRSGDDQYFMGMNVTEHYSKFKPKQQEQIRTISEERIISKQKIDKVYNELNKSLANSKQADFYSETARLDILIECVNATQSSLCTLNFEAYTRSNDRAVKLNSHELNRFAQMWSKIASVLRHIEEGNLTENSYQISLNLTILTDGKISPRTAGKFSDIGFFYLGRAGYLEKYIHSKFGQGDPNRELEFKYLELAIKCFKEALSIKSSLGDEYTQEIDALNRQIIDLENVYKEMFLEGLNKKRELLQKLYQSSKNDC